MKRIVLIVVTAVAIQLAGLGTIAILVTNAGREQVVARAEQTKTKYEVGPPDAQELLELVNAERARVGVAPLTLLPTMMQSAQWKAEDMDNRNYFGHTDPDTGKKNGLEYFYSIDDSCKYISENITDNTIEVDNYSRMSFNSWKNSEPHYKAMIDPQYTLTGFGISGTKVVQHFCIAK